MPVAVITAQDMGTIISAIGAIGIALMFGLVALLIAKMLRYRPPSDVMAEPYGDHPHVEYPAKRPSP